MSKANYKKKKKKNNKKKVYKRVVKKSNIKSTSKTVNIKEVINKEIENKDITQEVTPLKDIRKYNLTLIYFIIILYYEFLYQIFTFGIANLFSSKTLYYLVFDIIISIILNYLSKLFNYKVNKRVSISIVLILGIYYFASYLFKSVFNTYFSIHLLGVSDQAIAFMGTLIELVIKALPVLILYLIPFALVLKFKKHISFKRNKKIFIINFISLIISIVLFVFMINVNSEVKSLFYEIDNNAMNMEKLGVNVSTYLDIKRIFVKVEEKIDVSESIDSIKVDDKKEYEFNTTDIDFESLINNESNSTIKDMHEYISKNGATLKNEYTGIYKDKNLIVIMGESLNSIAISEKYTPTLYKLSHEGFEFTNFYTPVNLSTLGGEFQNLTGLFANLSMLSNYFRKGNNYFPYGLGNIYGNLGYTLNAYHPNYGSFQDRNKYLKAMGFDKFLYRGNGLEKKMNCNTWPQSDLDMVDVTIDDFINEDKFMTYYVSVSGHMPWGWSSNDMSKKNKNLLNGSGYSEEAAAYIAANIELDKAVEKIIQKLEETNKLDDTVIAVVPDHYPYSMNINTINELSSYNRDERFEVNHSTLILWNNKQEHKVIDKVCTQLDFIPTLYNLYGIEYDSRLFMGKDILSTSEGLAYFTDRSWISDRGRYISATNKFTPNEGVEVDENYVKNMNKIVSARINMSKLIIEHDYYRKVLK